MSTSEGVVWVAAHQFFIRDRDLRWDGAFSNDPWSGGDGLGVAPGLVAVQTPRAAGYAPVIVEVHEGEPAPSEGYCKVTEASVEVSSGALLVEGEENDASGSPVEVALADGTWRVRVLYADLDTCTYDDEDGADHYVVQLFPGEKREAEILAPFENVDDPVRGYEGGESVEALREVASVGSASARCSAVVALARLGALDEVLDVAQGGEPRSTRVVAAGALWLVQASEQLGALAASEDAAVAHIAEMALGRLGG